MLNAAADRLTGSEVRCSDDIAQRTAPSWVGIDKDKISRHRTAATKRYAKVVYRIGVEVAANLAAFDKYAVCPVREPGD
jgi:hypothetical protein